LRAQRLSRTGVWRSSRIALAAAISGLTIIAAGCGGAESRENELRPPIPVDVAVEIGHSRISVSPAKIGAGPAIVTAINLSDASRKLTIDGPQLKRSIGPINPDDTATLKVTVNPGEHTISTDNPTAVEPAKLMVGPERPSSQNKLQTP